jgi:hypothetical protein
MGALAVGFAAIANRIPFSGRPVKHKDLSTAMALYEPPEDE